jgi:hypothetical protein
MDALEGRLNDAQWLGGQQPSAEDREAFEGLSGAVPSADSHPNTFAWFALVSRFTDDVRKGWDGAAPAKAAKKEAKPAAKKEEKPAAADDDDFDPFADDGDEDPAAVSTLKPS